MVGGFCVYGDSLWGPTQPLRMQHGQGGADASGQHAAVSRSRLGRAKRCISVPCACLCICLLNEPSRSKRLGGKVVAFGRVLGATRGSRFVGGTNGQVRGRVNHADAGKLDELPRGRTWGPMLRGAEVCLRPSQRASLMQRRLGRDQEALATSTRRADRTAITRPGAPATSRR